MKKIFCSVFTLLIFCTDVFAQTIHVQAIQDFTTENPPKTFSVRLVENLIKSDESVIFNEGDVLEGIITVSAPKRLKRNAGFTFEPKYLISQDGAKSKIEGNYPAKFTTKLNKGEMAKSAVLVVGNHFVKGLSTGVAVVEGAIKNSEGNRFKSSAKSLYESTPISYIEKGKPVVLEKDGIFLLNFKTDDNLQDIPNYEYTPIDSTCE